jgi:hypothetical protein
MSNPAHAHELGWHGPEPASWMMTEMAQWGLIWKKGWMIFLIL